VTPHLLPFSTAFNCGRVARGSRGVFIPVALVVDSLSTRIIDVRVDSAASYSVFGQQWGDRLGLDWEAGDPLTIATAVGTFRARLHEVTIQLLDGSGQPGSLSQSGIPRRLRRLVMFWA
jgi:hypothetical protein